MTPAPYPLRAILLAFASFTAWVVADTFMKLAGEASLPPYETVAWLGVFCTIFMVAKAAPSGQVKALWPRRPGPQTVRALLSLGSNFFNAIALKHLPLTMFYATVFTAPMLVALLAAVCLRERMGWRKILAVIAGFVGVVVAIDPLADLSGGDRIGYACAAASTLCFAANTVWLRVMTQSESPDSIAFFTGLLEGALGLVCMMWFMVPVGPGLLAILAAMSLFCVIGNVLNYTALKLTAASNVMQFHYTQIVAGGVIGYLVWRDVPAWHTTAGAAIIIAAGLYVAALARREAAN